MRLVLLLSATALFAGGAFVGKNALELSSPLLAVLATGLGLAGAAVSRFLFAASRRARRRLEDLRDSALW